MTVAELYNYAKERKAENLPLTISYSCSDDWYSLFDEETSVENIEIVNNEVNIQMY